MFDALKMIALAAGLSLVPLLAGCNPNGRTVRMYDGRRLPAEQVATVRDTKDVQVVAVDGKLVGGAAPPSFTLSPFYSDQYAPPRDTFHLLPGPHRLEVRAYRVTVRGDTILTSTGVNAFTIRHDFSAGREYQLGLEEYADGGTRRAVPVLRDPGGGGETASIVKPRMRPEPPARPAAGKGGVYGLAAVEQQFATAKVVALLPDTAANRLWVREACLDRRERTVRRRRAELADVAVRSTLGYGMGFFEIPDVEPGRYLLFYQTGEDSSAASAEAVRVRADGLTRAMVVRPALGLSADPPADSTAGTAEGEPTRMSL